MYDFQGVLQSTVGPTFLRLLGFVGKFNAFTCVSAFPSSLIHLPLPPLFNPVIFLLPSSQSQAKYLLLKCHDGVYSGHITSDGSSWYEQTLRVGHRHLTCTIHLKYLLVPYIGNSPQLPPTTNSRARSSSKWKASSKTSLHWLAYRTTLVESSI